MFILWVTPFDNLPSGDSLYCDFSDWFFVVELLTQELIGGGVLEVSFEFVVVGFPDLEFVVGGELLVGLISVVSMNDFLFCNFSFWSL